MNKINIAILGATGMVGQRFVQLLSNHPYFNIKALLASEKSAGKEYQEACSWIISRKMPKEVTALVVKKADVESIKDQDIKIVFSALPSGIAKQVEPEFAKAGYGVFSNASAFRMSLDVPLVIAEINADHMQLIKHQQKKRNWPGFIITNPNCSTIIMALGLKPIQDAFGIQKIIVSTMQAVSGAGYPGVASLDIVDNVLPYISNEEDKVEDEPCKIFGILDPKSKAKIRPSDMNISATCQRVATTNGHLEDVHLSLKTPATVDEMKEILYGFRSHVNKLPTSPDRSIIVAEDPNRPQPKLDIMAGNGMSVTVGRIRKDQVLENGMKLTVLGHNTVRGAAGQSIQNAEYWYQNNV